MTVIGTDGRGEPKLAGETAVCGKWKGAFAMRLTQSPFNLHCSTVRLFVCLFVCFAMPPRCSCLDKGDGVMFRLNLTMRRTQEPLMPSVPPDSSSSAFFHGGFPFVFRLLTNLWMCPNQESPPVTSAHLTLFHPVFSLLIPACRAPSSKEFYLEWRRVMFEKLIFDCAVNLVGALHKFPTVGYIIE